MQDLEKLAQELRQSGKSRQLQALANSEEGRRLKQKLNGGALEQALRSGDSAALGQILREVLRTEEGRRLAQKLEGVMQK